MTKISTTNNRRTRSSAMPVPAPKRFSSALMREVKWFILAGLAIYMAIALLTYHASDPSWSHATDSNEVLNRGGIVGAWLADLVLYVMGVSVVWVLVFVLHRVILGYKRLMDWRILSDDEGEQPRLHVEKLIGFFALSFGSVGLEALQFPLFAASLPAGAGGVLGQIVSTVLVMSLGFDGAVLLSLTVFVIGSSLFFGFSWLSVCERIGAKLESTVLGIRDAWLAREDRKLGLEALQKRTVEIEAKQEQREHHEPVRIEPAVATVPKAPIATKTQQQSLFVDHGNADLPPLALLDPPDGDVVSIPAETLEYTSRLIEKKLADFGVTVAVMAAQAGPVITRYEIEPAVGVKGSQIVNLGKDLARALSLVSIRIVETIPGKNLMGLELPNPRRQTVRLSEILGSQVYHSSASKLTMALGKDIAGNPVVADLAKMPHLLVAGTTGSGKSVGINAMILSLLYKATANEVRLILIDPKMLEMSVYEGIPHLLAPVVTDMRHAANALNWCVAEMEKRYRLMSHMGVRNVAGFNAKILEAQRNEESIPNPFSLTPDQPEPLITMPMIVVVIDELADLMMVVGKKVEELIARLAQKARAAGIHLILATQRPSVDVITGLIKANIPTRIAFQVSSKIDSRTILDQMGAETLLGQGDMLYMPPGTALPQRVHGAFVSDEEVHRVVDKLKESGEPNYIEGLLEGGSEQDYGEGSGSVTGFSDDESDPLYDQAVEIVLSSRKASISLVQRQLRIGYNRAARLVEQMEKAGLVSAMQTNGVREVLAPKRDTD